VRGSTRDLSTRFEPPTVYADRGGATPPGGIRPDDGPAGGGRAENRVLYRADLDPVPHPCTTPPGPCRRPVLLKHSEVCSFAEYVAACRNRGEKVTHAN